MLDLYPEGSIGGFYQDDDLVRFAVESGPGGSADTALEGSEARLRDG